MSKQTQMNHKIPSDIQHVFDMRINPKLEGHGGHALPLSYKNGTLTIRFGGACHGCMAASDTLNEVIMKELHDHCTESEVKEVIASDDVDPEMWDFAKRILNGERP